MKRLLLFLLSFLLLQFGALTLAADGDPVLEGKDITGTIQWGTGGIFETPYSSVVTIAKAGAEYTTIQSALTANATADTLFVIYPGTYVNDTVNFTANNQYIVGFPVSPKVVLITNTTGICDFGAFTGCVVKDVKMVMTLAANAYDDCVTGTGSCNFKFVHAETIASGGAPTGGSTVYYGTGDFKIIEGSIVYIDSSTRGGQGKKAVLVGTGSTFMIDDVTFTVTGSSTSKTISAVRSNLAGNVTIDKCTINVTDNDSDAAYALSIINGTGTAEVSYNNIHVYNSTGDAAALYAAGGGAGIVIRTMYNHAHVVAGAGTANSIVIVNADTTITSQLDDIIALDGVSNSGNFVIVSSEIDGSLTLTNDISAGTIDLTDITDTNIPYMSGAAAGFADSPFTTDGTDITNSGDVHVQGGDVTVGLVTVPGNIWMHDAGSLYLYDADDDFSVSMAVTDGTTKLRLLGSLDASAQVIVGSSLVPDSVGGATFGLATLEWGNGYFQDGAIVYFGNDQDVNLTHVADTGLTTNLNFFSATYGSDSSISDADLLAIDDGATTTIAVGGGVGSPIAWTTATGTGAPVRAGSPTFTSGLTVPAINLTGGVITFPAPGNGSAGVNVLDDYEEGTWTPTFTSTDATFTHGTRVGRYTKIGDLVFCTFYLRTTATAGTTSNGLSISALPFTSLNITYISSAGSFSYISGLTITHPTLIGEIGQNSTNMSLYSTSNLSLASVLANNLEAAANSFIVGSFTYKTPTSW